jgi:hypothetical protein
MNRSAQNMHYKAPPAATSAALQNAHQKLEGVSQPCVVIKLQGPDRSPAHDDDAPDDHDQENCGVVHRWWLDAKWLFLAHLFLGICNDMS